jgi:Phage phiEco32-like COOH.NH2 ligase-type 2
MVEKTVAVAPEKEFVAKQACTVGTDPEIFAFKAGKLLPAFEFLPGKDKPLNEDGTSAYWDGFQAEFRLHRAYTCLMELHSQLWRSMCVLHTAAGKHGAKLGLQSVVRIPLSILRTAHDPYVELGCQPSFNAYNLAGLKVANPRELRYRFAGGHMHFGLSYSQPKYEETVRSLDSILGIWSVGAAKSFDNPIRRQYYGLPGEFRKPKYQSGALGIEYRTLSNFWLSHPAISMVTWEIGRRAVQLAYGEFPKAIWVGHEEEVKEAIANSDVKVARSILKRNEAIFKWLFVTRGWTADMMQRAFDVGLNGIESEVKDPTDIEKNWMLDKRGTGADIFSPFNATPYWNWRGHCLTTREVHVA